MIIKKYLIILLFLSIILCHNPNISYGKEYRSVLLGKKGIVYLHRKNKPTLIRKIPISLAENDVIITKRDSSVVFRVDNRIFKVFSYSKVVVKKVPILVYGKLQFSKSGKFVEPHFKIYPIPKEGKTTKILLWGTGKGQSISGKIERNNITLENIHFYKIGESYYKALMGIPLGIDKGKYRIKIIINGEQKYGLIKYPFYVRKIKYKSGRVNLASKKRELLLPSKEKIEEQKVLRRVLQRSFAKQYWSGRFIYPVRNHRIISDFGKKRKYYINGNYLYQRFHYGIDLYGKKGTEIFAPNSGIIAFAGNRITTGNTIVIDHGLGVFSLFFHLDEIDVNQGNFVGKGCLIGKVGNTGLAESSHLHWGLLVNMVYVDPVQWIEYKF